MLFRNLSGGILLALIINSVQAAPSVEPIYSNGEDILSKLIYGGDGRLYGQLIGAGSVDPGIWSTELDGTDYQLHLYDFSVENSTTDLVVNSRGQFYFGHELAASCPSHTRELIDGIPTVVEESWGGIVQYTPWVEGEADRYQDITSSLGYRLCPTGPMVVGADDNLYFLSEVELSDPFNPGTKLYQLSSDGELTLVKEFVTNADGDNASIAADEGYNPIGLVVSDDGQALYGINADGGPDPGSGAAPLGTIFKIDIDNYFNYSVVRYAQLFDEYTVSSIPFIGLVHHDDNLYYPTPDHPAVAGGDGMLNGLDLSAATPIWTRLVDFNGATTPKGKKPKSLDLGLDEILYGTTNWGGVGDGNGNGTIFSYDPDADTFSTVYEFVDDDAAGINPGSLIAGWDGKLYGTARNSDAGNVVFNVDPDTTINAPVIRAFWTETPELDWQGSGTEVTLNWDVTNPSGAGTVNCTASGDWSTAINDLADGTATVFVDHQGTNEYRLSCDNGVDSSARLLRVSAAVEADPVAILSFTASASRLTQGETLTVNWQTENAASCEASWGVISNSNVDSGSHSFEPDPGDHTYELICTGLAGGEVSSTPIRVSVAVANPVDAGGSLSLWALLSLGFMMLLRRKADSV